MGFSRQRNRIGLFLLLAVLGCFFGQAQAMAQDVAEATPSAEQSARNTNAASAIPKQFTALMRAVDSVSMKAGRSDVYLWGVTKIDGAGAQFDLKARTALDNLMDSKKVQCEFMGRVEGRIEAQCLNAQGVDIALYMVQQGYAVVDRGLVYGTVYEEPYIQSEKDAQNAKLGIWTDNSSPNQFQSQRKVLLIMGLVLLLFVVGAFFIISFLIIRGFKKIVEAQERNIDLFTKERKLREKEKYVIGALIDSELRANISKLEAYLVIYEEMLKEMKNPGSTPKYQISGDMLQKQPALDRSIFDGNTDKLDLLPQPISSRIIHFYARVKTKPDYITLERDMPLEQAVAMVEKILANSKNLHKILVDLTARMAKGGFSRKVEDGSAHGDSGVDDADSSGLEFIE